MSALEIMALPFLLVIGAMFFTVLCLGVGAMFQIWREFFTGRID